MEGTSHLRELTEALQSAVDAYVKSDDIANYKELQTCLTRLQVASTKPADTLFTFRLQVLVIKRVKPLACSECFLDDRECRDLHADSNGNIGRSGSETGRTSNSYRPRHSHGVQRACDWYVSLHEGVDM